MDPVCILYFMSWVLLSRGAVCVVYFISTGKWHPAFPFVLYYNQVAGAAIKIYMNFHPNRQRWTRQAPGRKLESGLQAMHNLTSDLYAGISVALFVLGVVIVVSVLNVKAHTAVNPCTLAAVLSEPATGLDASRGDAIAPSSRCLSAQLTAARLGSEPANGLVATHPGDTGVPPGGARAAAEARYARRRPNRNLISRKR